jgi:diacylglycerol kinase (ATP)
MSADIRVLIIHNPGAGRGRAAGRIAELTRTFAEANIAHDLVATQSKGQGVALAAGGAKAGYSAIVAAGGDGTINEVINGAALSPHDDRPILPIGIYPIGGGNDLAHSLGLTADAKALSLAILSGRVRRVDLGLATVKGHSGEVHRFFHNSLGFGLEASVTRESDQIRSLTGGPLYLVAAFRALRSYVTPLATIEWIDDQGQSHSLEQEITIVSIGNAKRTGGAFYLTPDALVDDELFDVAMAGAVSRVGLISLLPRVLVGKHTDAKAVRMLKCRQISVRSREPLPAHMDGEVVMLDAMEANAVIDAGRLPILA